ncbi:hypothetical protein HDE_12102 [Halotydeus destructor]|nr:hypothetical protein HDE_12102 [Halotydeus destructor]
MDSNESLEKMDNMTIKELILSDESTWDDCLESKIKTLLESGKEKLDTTELTLALSTNCSTELVQILLDYGCCVTYTDVVTCLESNRFHVFRKLMESLTDHVAQEIGELRPHALIQFLHNVSEVDAEDIAKSCRIFVEKCQIDVNFDHASYHTALQEAILFREEEVLDYLLNVPTIDLELAGEQESRKPLQLAVDCGRFSFAEKLIRNCASWEELNIYDLTENGFSGVFALLFFLGYPFDMELLRKREDPSVNYLKELDFFFDDWLISEKNRLKTLKEVAAVGLRRMVKCKEELRELLEMCQWSKDIKGYLELDHIELDVPAQYTEHQYNHGIYGFSSDDDFYDEDDDFYDDFSDADSDGQYSYHNEEDDDDEFYG